MTEIISAIISASVAFIVGLIVSYQNKRQVFSSVVSRGRMDWVRDIRELSAELFTILEQYPSKAELPQEKYEKFLKAKNSIILRLSPQGFHQLDDEILQVLQYGSYDEISANMTLIRDRIVLIGKTEWEKVKVEAGSSQSKIDEVKQLQATVGYAKDMVPDEGFDAEAAGTKKNAD